MKICKAKTIIDVIRDRKSIKINFLE